MGLVVLFGAGACPLRWSGAARIWKRALKKAGEVLRCGVRHCAGKADQAANVEGGP